MKVLKSWGAEGQVAISLGQEDPQDLNLKEPVFIEFDGLPVPFFIETAERKGSSRVIVKFEDVDTLEGAEELVGRVIRLEGDEEEEDGSLVGMTVIDAASGAVVGPITEMYDYSGNICISVDWHGREVMLPVHEDLIKKVRKDKITLIIPDGLLEA